MWIFSQKLLFYVNNYRLFTKLYKVWIEYRSDDVTKNFFCINFSVLDTMSRWSMMKNIHSPNLVGIGSWGPKIWPHEYLLSPIEISVNWPGSNSYWTRPIIYTDFNGVNLGIHVAISWATMNRFMSNLVCGGFSSCSTEIWSWKCWNANKNFWWRHTSVLYYSALLIHTLKHNIWHNS